MGTRFQVVRHRECLDCLTSFFTREVEDHSAARDLIDYHILRYYPKGRHKDSVLPVVKTIDQPAA